MKYTTIPIVKSPKGTNRNIQSTPRVKKQLTAKKSIGLKLATNTASQLNEKAVSMHLSRNALMTLAIERCLQEDVWRNGDGATVARNIAANPDPRMVELSNILLSLAFIANKLLTRNTRKQREELGRICLDAQADLRSLRSSLGC